MLGPLAAGIKALPPAARATREYQISEDRPYHRPWGQAGAERSQSPIIAEHRALISRVAAISPNSEINRAII